MHVERGLFLWEKNSIHRIFFKKLNKMITLIERLGNFDGFFHKMTGRFAKDITGGTKEVDALVNKVLSSANEKTKLEYAYPFPTIVENQGNVFAYEDFSSSRLAEELAQATDKILKSKFAGNVAHGSS